MEKRIPKHLVHMSRLIILAIMALGLSINLMASNGQPLAKMNELNVNFHQNIEDVDVTVRGTVTDATGSPIPGVTVSESGTLRTISRL